MKFETFKWKVISKGDVTGKSDLQNFISECCSRNLPNEKIFIAISHESKAAENRNIFLGLPNKFNILTGFSRFDLKLLNNYPELR